MKLVALMLPGRDFPLGYDRASALGYSVSVVYAPAFRSGDALTDKYASRKEQSFIQNVSPGGEHRKVARPLRGSWYMMLTYPDTMGKEDVLFCEADALPLIPAKDLWELLKQLPEDADVVRLCKTLVRDKRRPIEDIPLADPEKVEWKEYPEVHGDHPLIWGTHALYIPAKSRQKVANVFRDVRLPVDDALAYAHNNKMIKAYTSNINLFVQIDRLPDEKPAARKFALIMTSYRRYKDCMRQIYAMMDQTYQNFSMFVAVKGMAEADVNQCMIPLFRHWIDTGKLMIRSYPNGTQLANHIDTIRGIDLSPYDLLVKIDDDDIYARNYLQKLNELHQSLPLTTGSSTRIHGRVLQQRGGYPILGGNGKEGDFYGSHMVIPKWIMEALMEYEVDKSSIFKYFPEAATDEKIMKMISEGYSWREDALILLLMRRHGFVDREYICGTEHCNIVCRAAQSVTKFDGLPEHLLNQLFGQTERLKEHIIRLQEDKNIFSYYRIYGNKIKDLRNSKEGRIVEFDPYCLYVQWGKSNDVNIYKKSAEGTYVYHKIKPKNKNEEAVKGS